ncbi:MAG: hypothetical protein HQK92_15725 [Nitrospirae bacterium]|nr:hypothetical protein [Nitrospirota bacterium]
MMLKKVVVVTATALLFAVLFSTLLEAFPPPYPPFGPPPPRYIAPYPYPLPPAPPPAYYPVHRRRHVYVVPSVLLPVPVVQAPPPVAVEATVWVPWFPVPLWVVPNSGNPPRPWEPVPR